VTNVRPDSNRRSRLAPDGTVEDRCERCGFFRPRRLFASGRSTVCRPCREAHRPTVVGALAPSGRTPATEPASVATVSSPGVTPCEYRLTRGRHKGERLSEVPLTYLRACAYGKGSTVPTRAHILWGGEVRMIRLYLEQVEHQG
jgi:hypothetical protein